MPTPTSAAGRVAAATPTERDRFADLLRVASIGVVVAGHWLMAVVGWRGGRVEAGNAIALAPGLWLATWLLQVMPLFFFVGGFSNLVTLDSLNRKGKTYADFVSTRAARLLKPTAIFLAVWIPISIVLDVFFNLNVRAFELSMKLLTAPLWFLGVYLIMIGMAPKMLKIHRRFGRGALATMAMGAVVVDVLGIWMDVPFIGALNYLFIWLFAHQLGFFYADGSLLRLGRKLYLAMAAGGLGGLVLLTQVADYSPNMVFNVHGRSNTNPPTVCILVLTIWQVGLAMLLRDPVSKVLARRKPWAGVIALNGLMMTMFLWHMTAAVIIAAAVYPLGFPGPEAGTPLWWALRPVWVAMLAGTLLVLVAVFGRYERGRPKRKAASAPASQPDTVRLPLTRGQQVATVLGLVYCILGFIGFATASFGGFASADGNSLFGFTMNPLQSLIHLAVGWTLLNAGNAGAERARSAAWQAVALLAVLGLAGILFLGANPSFNVIAVNRAISVLHLLSAAAAGALLVKRRVSVPA
jgi:hypothetical protein